MTTRIPRPRPDHPGAHAVLGFVDRDPAFAAVAARQHALLRDAAAARHLGDASEVRRRRWPRLPRILVRARCQEATP